MKCIQRTLLVISTILMLVLAAACASASAATLDATVAPETPTPISPPAAEAPTSAAAPVSAAAPAVSGDITGASLYQLSCAACHGKDRAGQKFEADGQSISVPSLAWDELSKTYQSQPSRGAVADQLALTITKGQDESGDDLAAMMPRWSSFSKVQVDSLIQFLQTAGTNTGEASNLSPAVMNLQGEQLYQVACSACHGQDRAGQKFEIDGQTITAPSLAWDELSKTYQSQQSRGTVAEQLALTITKGQDEEGGDLNAMMPRWSFLSKAQVDSLIQYLQSASQ